MSIYFTVERASNSNGYLEAEREREFNTLSLSGDTGPTFTGFHCSETPNSSTNQSVPVARKINEPAAETTTQVLQIIL